MLFMGEEYGEEAPFQFFTDHIDPRIAEATREGRREEFAAFAAVRRRRSRIPQAPADLRALEADAGAATRSSQRLYRELLARAARALERRGRDDRRSMSNGRWLRVRARASTS